MPYKNVQKTDKIYKKLEEAGGFREPIKGKQGPAARSFLPSYDGKVIKVEHLSKNMVTGGGKQYSIYNVMPADKDTEEVQIPRDMLPGGGEKVDQIIKKNLLLQIPNLKAHIGKEKSPGSARDCIL